MGIKVAGASVDSVEQVQDLKAGLQVGFPMFAELDVEAVNAATGAHIQTGDRTMVHATGFLVGPDGVVMDSVYATGPIGRYTASDIIRKTRFEMDMAAR